MLLCVYPCPASLSKPPPNIVPLLCVLPPPLSSHLTLPTSPIPGATCSCTLQAGKQSRSSWKDETGSWRVVRTQNRTGQTQAVGWVGWERFLVKRTGGIGWNAKLVFLAKVEKKTGWGGGAVRGSCQKRDEWKRTGWDASSFTWWQCINDEDRGVVKKWEYLSPRILDCKYLPVHWTVSNVHLPEADWSIFTWWWWWLMRMIDDDDWCHY